MDDFSMKGDLLRDTLDKLGSINKWLGGNKVTLNGVHKLIKHQPRDRTIVVVDLGCGHGDMLRLVAQYGRKHGFQLKLIGLDANEDAINYARELSVDYPEIQYNNWDIFSDDFDQLNYDVALSTLFLHHFSDDEIKPLLQKLILKAKIGIVINDLHRHELAYFLFKLLGFTISNEMIVQDGLTSILRAFKRNELEQLSRELQLKSQIRWKWAFRYQWLITH